MTPAELHAIRVKNSQAAEAKKIAQTNKPSTPRAVSPVPRPLNQSGPAEVEPPPEAERAELARDILAARYKIPRKPRGQRWPKKIEPKTRHRPWSEWPWAAGLRESIHHQTITRSLKGKLPI